MIDIHTHILYDIDDGSTDLETSVKHIANMSRSGVTDIFLTPHYIRYDFPTSKENIENRFQNLQKEISNKNIKIKLHKACEVYLDDNIWEDIEAQNLMINDTKYVLVETTMNGFQENLYEILFDLVRRGYRPIMAHPERYRDVYNELQVAEDLIFRNVYLQINAGSLLGLYGEKIKKTAWKLLQNGFAHFLASDNHCQNDDYVLPEAIEMLNSQFDSSYTELLTQTNPQKVLNDEPIEFFNNMNEPLQEKVSFFQKFLDFLRK